MKRYIKILIIIVSIMLFSYIFITKNYNNYDKKFPIVEKIEIVKYENDIAILNLITNKKDSFCYITDKIEEEKDNSKWLKSKNGICEITIDIKNDYYIYLKDSVGNVNEAVNLKDILNVVLDIKLDKTKVYLAVNGISEVKDELVVIGDKNQTLTWISDDYSIATVDNGKIKGIKSGKTTITAKASNGLEKSVEVIVTDLINIPTFDNTKDFIPCNRYTKEEAKLLDEILLDRINEAGYQTRAGVLAAIRFLTLEFPYRLNYFPENGRLNNHGYKRYVDGEGRYYHKGLYLSEDKFSDIVASATGPAIWGCDLYLLQSEEDQSAGYYYNNGIDCSGFVSWGLLNGGFDVKDSGAGDTMYDDDLSDLGKHSKIDLNLLKSGKIKAGDYIAFDGHAALIIGIDDEYVYIAESLYYNIGLNILKYTYEQLAYKSPFRYIILMDDVYKNDGNYSAMW